MKNEIAVIRIKLKDSFYTIRRRVEVDPSITLEDFHEIIQIVMGWEDCHMYHFVADGVTYNPELVEEYTIPEELKDYVKPEKPCITTRLKDILNSKKIIYTYDFGDNWKHEIILNRYIEGKKGFKYPFCANAKGICPPEEIGGIWTCNDIIREVESGNFSERTLERIEEFGLSIEKLKNIENETVDVDCINKKLELFEEARKMNNKELLDKLCEIGPLPSDQDEASGDFSLKKFAIYFCEIKLPIDFETVIKLIKLSPPLNTTYYGYEYNIVDLIEEYENYCEDFNKIIENCEENEVKNILKMRMENYLKN